MRRGNPDDIALTEKIEQAESAGICILPGGTANPGPNDSGNTTPITPEVNP